jgi:hypothetical protein
MLGEPEAALVMWGDPEPELVVSVVLGDLESE